MGVHLKHLNAHVSSLTLTCTPKINILAAAIIIIAIIIPQRYLWVQLLTVVSIG